MRKYRNKPAGGNASQAEHKRAQELRLLERAGKIRNLREQVKYELIPKQDGERACTYTPDFTYEVGFESTQEFGWRTVVEDKKSKPTKTPAYIIKRKLMLFRHGIRVLET